MKKKKMIAIFITMECIYIYISLLLTGCVLVLRSCNPNKNFERRLVINGILKMTLYPKRNMMRMEDIFIWKMINIQEQSYMLSGRKYRIFLNKL